MENKELPTEPPIAVAKKQIPSVGRVVHWHASKDSPPEAAWVIAVNSDDVISVQRCNSGGTWSTSHSVSLEGVNAEGSFWRWPPFVPSK